MELLQSYTKLSIYSIILFHEVRPGSIQMETLVLVILI